VKLTDQILSGGSRKTRLSLIRLRTQVLFNLAVHRPGRRVYHDRLEARCRSRRRSGVPGLDWDFSYTDQDADRHRGLQWTGTQMFRQKYNFAPAAKMFTDLASSVRTMPSCSAPSSTCRLSLATGQSPIRLTGHYSRSYKEGPYPRARPVSWPTPTGPGSVGRFPGLDVPSYTTFRLADGVRLTKSMHVTLGIKEPVRQGSAADAAKRRGRATRIGYDGRYATFSAA